MFYKQKALLSLSMKVLEQTQLPTSYGLFNMIAVDSGVADFPHLILCSADLEKVKTPFVRIHSECMTGDVFSSSRCDCGDQLELSQKIIATEGGALLYLRQEGRGIGLINKMKAYNLQDTGLDTYDANLKLGLHQDSRDFSVAIEMLNYLGIKEIKLLTNNPEKLKALEHSDIKVVERVPLEIKSNNVNEAYLKTKKDKAGHLFSQF